jgi:hypothetical protein
MVMETRQEGLSPKVVAGTVMAALIPTLGGIVAVGIQWVSTGEFSRAELATALTAAASAVLTAAGVLFAGYRAEPGTVVGAIPVEDVLQDPPFEQHVGTEG